MSLDLAFRTELTYSVIIVVEAEFRTGVSGRLWDLAGTRKLEKGLSAAFRLWHYWS